MDRREFLNIGAGAAMATGFAGVFPGCAAAAAVFFINAVLGLLVLLLSPGGQTVRFAAAQGNFSSSAKWSATASETLET